MMTESTMSLSAFCCVNRCLNVALLSPVVVVLCDDVCMQACVCFSKANRHKLQHSSSGEIVSTVHQNDSKREREGEMRSNRDLQKRNEQDKMYHSLRCL